jgi:hypothetical protein
MMSLCEIRVPTYRRPRLLERALRSLQAQTRQDWVALVMDDSPAQDGRDIVIKLNDPRIQYRPNQNRLGCAGNLDQAFATPAYAGAAFACVLEDDNWYFPKFLAANIQALEQRGLSILMRNQQIFLEDTELAPVESSATTRGGVFTEGVVPILRLRASMFFCTGISNGGLFWRTTARTSFQVGPEVKTSPMQEFCRTIMVSEPAYFAAEPLAAFSRSPETTREPLANRSFNRGRQTIWRRLIKAHGQDLVEEARRMAQTPEMHEQIKAALCDVLALSHLPVGEWSLKQVGKGIAKIVTIPDPLADFWRVKGFHGLASAVA